MSSDELAKAVKQMDENSNGLIEECEFMEFMKRMKRSFDLDKYTQRLFDHLTNGSTATSASKNSAKPQQLTRQQMQSFLSRLDPSISKPDFELMWAELDTDSDGSINREQFVQFMTGWKA